MGRLDRPRRLPDRGPIGLLDGNGIRVDVFGTGGDFGLYQRVWGASSGWIALGAPPFTGISGSPSVSWTESGSRVDVFVTGSSDGHVNQRFWNGSWSGWIDLG